MDVRQRDARRFGAGAAAQAGLLGAGLVYSSVSDVSKGIKSVYRDLTRRNRDVNVSVDPYLQSLYTYPATSSTGLVPRSLKTRPIDKLKEKIVKKVSQINGNNGEATNTDDVKPSKRAAKAKKRAAKVAVAKSSMGRGPVIVVQQQKKGKRRSRRRRVRGDPGASVSRFVSLRDSPMVTDGVNRSRIVTSRGSVEDTFSIRREKVCNVSGTSAFTISNFFINPANSALFPAFAPIASCYEQYKVNHLRFYFVSDAYASIGTTASAGKVIMATNFDANDSNFASEVAIEDYEGMIRGVPYADLLEHDVVDAHTRRTKSNLPLKSYYVYPSNNQVAPGFANYVGINSPQFYDVGNFQYATSGNGVTTEIGEIYVEYSFTMIHMRIAGSTDVGSALQQLHLIESAASTADATHFFGTTAGGTSIVSHSTLNPTVTNTYFTFGTAPVGCYLYIQAAKGSLTGVMGTTVGSNVTFQTVFQDSTASSMSTTSSGSGILIGEIIYSGLGTSTTNRVTPNTLTGLTAGQTDVFLSQVTSSLLFAKRSDRLSDAYDRIYKQVKFAMMKESLLKPTPELLLNGNYIEVKEEEKKT